MKYIFVISPTGLPVQPPLKELSKEGFSVTGVIRNIDKRITMRGGSCLC